MFSKKNKNCFYCSLKKVIKLLGVSHNFDILILVNKDELILVRKIDTTFSLPSIIFKSVFKDCVLQYFFLLESLLTPIF